MIGKESKKAMTFNILGKQIDISDEVISDYRKAEGLRPGMKTDERWLVGMLKMAFGENEEEIFNNNTITAIEEKLTEFIQADTQMVLDMGGGNFS